VPQDGVRTFLPPSHLAITKPAITRPARLSYYTARFALLMRIVPQPRQASNPLMQVREAKDFLVRQTEIQATIDGIPFSDQEKKLMYFTESQESEEEGPEDFAEGVDDVNYDYEAKIYAFLHHAYSRIKKENPEERHLWDEAIRTLRQGDHYILVLWDHNPYQKLFSPSFWKLLAVGILVLIILMIGFVASLHYGDSKPTQPKTTGSIPSWVQHLLLALIIGSYLAVVLLPRLFTRLFGWFRNTTNRK
jgi:hypothetical protein